MLLITKIRKCGRRDWIPVIFAKNAAYFITVVVQLIFQLQYQNFSIKIYKYYVDRLMKYAR
jgi:hypothetical protein